MGIAEIEATGGKLTDEGQVQEVEEPLWDALAKDWPAVVFFTSTSGVNSCG